MLEEVRSYMTDQYFSRGKYAVRIDPKVEEVPGNKVRIKIEVDEGKRARIRQINLVGNEAYDDKELLDAFELRTPNWLSWYRQDDRYSREELSGDIETLRSYYMDRGYANFDVETTQVAIAPAEVRRHLPLSHTTTLSPGRWVSPVMVALAAWVYSMKLSACLFRVPPWHSVSKAHFSRKRFSVESIVRFTR